ncbi:hypothetical protein KCU92_g295, partial [Aureobasidium melanogenum]
MSPTSQYKACTTWYSAQCPSNQAELGCFQVLSQCQYRITLPICFPLILTNSRINSPHSALALERSLFVIATTQAINFWIAGAAMMA